MGKIYCRTMRVAATVSWPSSAISRHEAHSLVAPASRWLTGGHPARPRGQGAPGQPAGCRRYKRTDDRRSRTDDLIRPTLATWPTYNVHRMKSVIVGTAGHIDHGKTALVKALTGIDADRLEEEKRRGITIDIGFAHLELPQPGGEILRLGFVDVPGHERFVRNMLAGVGGIDLVLL